MSNVIPFRYQGQVVRFNAKGWIDAASAARGFGKEPTAWLRSIETLEYMSAMAEALFGKGVSETDLARLRTMSQRTAEAKALTLRLSKETGLVITKAGRGGGTWLHPKLAVRFAQWLEVKFAVWCDLQIDALIHGDIPAQQQFDRACKALASGQQVASLSGKQLAEWRRRKPGLEREVERWRDQLQLTLGFEAA